MTINFDAIFSCKFGNNVKSNILNDIDLLGDETRNCALGELRSQAHVSPEHGNRDSTQHQNQQPHTK